MLFEDMLQKCNELAEEAIDTAIVVSPKDCGLDRRAASRMWRGKDFLAVRAHGESSFEYYSGFEYVKPEHRLCVGEFVFYSTDSDRVNSHWEQLEPEVEPELCVHCNGSGEGQYDGTRCSYCGGRGSVETKEE